MMRSPNAVPVLWMLLFLMSCSQAIRHERNQIPTQRHAAVDLEAVQALLWAGEFDFALALLQSQRWENTGSVAAERRWQDLMRRNGQDEQVLLSLADLRERFPGLDPDLDYLEARILEDGPTRAKQLERLHRRWPNHPWIQLGHAASQQLLGNWLEAEELLQDAPMDGEAGSFARALLARQAVEQGRARQAFRLLEVEAFEQGRELALFTYMELAQATGDDRRMRRAEAEVALRAAPQADPLDATRIDLGMERFFAERPWLGDATLDELLVRLDQYVARADAPSGWAQQPRYEMAGFATLVQPEPRSGPVAEKWLAANRFLLAGDAVGRGPEIHLLTDTSSLQVSWPGEDQDLTILLARGVADRSQRIAQGGTVFRGFYLRIDDLQRGVEELQRRMLSLGMHLGWKKAALPESPPQSRADPNDLESQNLPDRLRWQRLLVGDTSVQEQELRHLIVHESGHLGEILPWLNHGLPLLQVVPLFLKSQSDFGSAMLWLEYRAELRAMASADDPRWFLAEIVERAQNPRDSYHAPYRRILRQLLRIAAEEEAPALADWDQVPPATMQRWAQELLAREELDPIPQQGLEVLWSELDQLNLFQEAPLPWPPLDPIDDGQVESDG